MKQPNSTPKDYLHLPNRIAYDTSIYTTIDAYIQQHQLWEIRKNIASAEHTINTSDPLSSMIYCLDDAQKIYNNDIVGIKKDLMKLVPGIRKALHIKKWTLKQQISNDVQIRKELITHNIFQQIHLYENHRERNWDILEVLSLWAPAHSPKKKETIWTTMKIPFPEDVKPQQYHNQIAKIHSIDDSRNRYLTRLLVFLVLEDELA